MIRNRKGFTLIELIIVVIIIGILAAIAAPIMSRMKTRAIIAEGVAGLGTIREVLCEYYVENGKYPDSIGTVFFFHNGPTDAPPLGLSITYNGLMGTYFSP